MSEPYVYEFLWRGGAKSSPDDNTWHIILEQEVIGPDDSVTLVRTAPMSPVAAEARGFTLSRIVSDMNEAAIAQSERVRDAQRLQGISEQHVTMLQTRMRTMYADYTKRMEKMEKDRDDRIAELEARLAASNMEKDGRAEQLEKSLMELRRQKNTADNMRKAHERDAEASREAVVKWRTEAETVKEAYEKEVAKAQETALKATADAEKRVAEVERAAAARIELAEAFSASAQSRIDAVKAEADRAFIKYEHRIKTIAEEAATVSGLTGANKERYLARMLSEPTGS